MNKMHSTIAMMQSSLLINLTTKKKKKNKSQIMNVCVHSSSAEQTDERIEDVSNDAKSHIGSMSGQTVIITVRNP